MDVDLIAGSNGIFEIIVDGSLVFSKKQAGRFPENEEVLTLVERLKM